MQEADPAYTHKTRVVGKCEVSQTFLGEIGKQPPLRARVDAAAGDGAGRGGGH